MQLLEILTEFGLNKKEAAVYLAALELGESSMLELSQKSKIKRSTVYEVIGKLAEGGFVTTAIKEKKRQIIATTPKDLLKMSQQKEGLLKNALPQLESIYNLSPVKPKVRYYEGRIGVESVLRETLECKEKIVYYLLPKKSFFERASEDLADWLAQGRVKKKIRTKAIMKRGEKVKWKYGSPKWDKKILRESRFAPQGFSFNTTMAIYDDKVVMITSKKEDVAVVIESPDYAETMKTFYKALWQVSSKK